MRYRKVFYDGGSGAKLGDIVDEETALREAAGSRNGDGLLENSQSDVLYVPVDDDFDLNPACQNEEEEDGEEEGEEEEEEEEEEEGEEDGEEEEEEEEEEGDGGLVPIFVEIRDTEFRPGITADELETAARELLEQRGIAAGEFSLDPPDQEVMNGGVSGNLDVDSAVWRLLEKQGHWTATGNGIKIEAEMP